MAETDKERFSRIARSESPGELALLGSFNSFLWPETLGQWVNEGLPSGLGTGMLLNMMGQSAPEVDSYFGFARAHTLREIGSGDAWSKELGSGEITPELVRSIPEDQLSAVMLLVMEQQAISRVPLWPRFEQRVLAEGERQTTLVNISGVTMVVMKGSSGMPHFVDFPVKNREDWNSYKKRLDPESPERLPANWEAFADGLNASGKIVEFHGGGFVGFLREWMGLEPLLYAFYDEPAWVEEMMDFVVDFQVAMMRKVLPAIKVDLAIFFEDMCYRAGPLVSPDLVRRLFVPRYKKLTEVARSLGVPVVAVDSDGNIDELVPLWIESGFNGIWPVEIGAGGDPVALKKKYGKDLVVMGGIDKRALALGEAAIREEVMSKVPFLLEAGGYF
ncbi:MAG: uroporphyrinogen decarboxylase family protein, partial [Actinomycetota bacterium]